MGAGREKFLSITRAQSLLRRLHASIIEYVLLVHVWKTMFYTLYIPPPIKKKKKHLKNTKKGICATRENVFLDNEEILDF